MFGSVPGGISNDTARGRGFFATKMLTDCTPVSEVSTEIGTTAPFSAISGAPRLIRSVGVAWLVPNNSSMAWLAWSEANAFSGHAMASKVLGSVARAARARPPLMNSLRPIRIP